MHVAVSHLLQVGAVIFEQELHETKSKIETMVKDCLLNAQSKCIYVPTDSGCNLLGSCPPPCGRPSHIALQERHHNFTRTSWLCWYKFR